MVKLGRSCDQGTNNGVSADAGEALMADVATSAPTTTANDLTLRRLARTCIARSPSTSCDSLATDRGRRSA